MSRAGSSARRRQTSGGVSAAGAGAVEAGLVAIGPLAVLLRSCWPVVVSLFEDWQNDPNYSICTLVPLAAFYLLGRGRAGRRV